MKEFCLTFHDKDLTNIPALLEYFAGKHIAYSFALKTDNNGMPLLNVTGLQDEGCSDDLNCLAKEALDIAKVENVFINHGDLTVIDREGDLVSWGDGAWLEKMKNEDEKNTDKIKEAYRRYPVEHFGTKGMINATSRKLFLEGATWRETHPDMQTVEKVLVWLTRKGHISQYDMIKLSEQYIEEH